MYGENGCNFEPNPMAEVGPAAEDGFSQIFPNINPQLPPHPPHNSFALDHQGNLGLSMEELSYHHEHHHHHHPPQEDFLAAAMDIELQEDFLYVYLDSWKLYILMPTKVAFQIIYCSPHIPTSKEFFFLLLFS